MKSTIQHKHITVDLNQMSCNFMVSDIDHALKNLYGDSTKYTIVDIEGVNSFHNNDNFISDTVKQMVADGGLEVPIVYCTRAYVSTEEFSPTDYVLYHDENTLDKLLVPMDETLKRESAFISSLGFVSINDYVGYEHYIAYVYPNEIGQKVIDYLNSLDK